MMQGAHWPVIGHRSAVDLLRRSLESDQVGHAYLFAGPEGIGRRTLARTFAQALVCTAQRESRPCGQCSACRRTVRGIHPDVVTVNLELQSARDSRDSKNTRISIETIRELRSNLSLRPLESQWRVAILEDVDLFSMPAYDALLKTLEEPPPFVVLLLVATEVDAVPETIRSRCRPIVLEPLSRADVASALLERGVEADLAIMISGITRGRIGKAFELSADKTALAARRETIDEGIEMVADPLEAIGAVRRMADGYRRGQRARVERELDALLGIWRDLMLLSTGCIDQVVNVDVVERLDALCHQWSLDQIHDGVQSTYQALFDLSINVQPRLALDRMVTQWPRPAS